MKRVPKVPWFFGVVAITMMFSSIVYAVTCNNNLPASNPDGIYISNGDGTVIDTTTGLMWKGCTEGLSGQDCESGTAVTYTWQDALILAESSTFAGYTDWRVPNVRELNSLVEDCRVLPAINNNLFDEKLGTFWSSSPSMNASNTAWSIDFSFGLVTGGISRNDSLLVRLVRGGQ